MKMVNYENLPQIHSINLTVPRWDSVRTDHDNRSETKLGKLESLVIEIQEGMRDISSLLG